MSKMYNKIKNWYDMGIFKKKQVHDCVVKGQITPEEYTLITGESYEK